MQMILILIFILILLALFLKATCFLQVIISYMERPKGAARIIAVPYLASDRTSKAIY